MPSPAPQRGLNIQQVSTGLVFVDNILSGSGTATDVVVTDDNATNAAVFLVWVTAAGTVPEFISSGAGSLNPSTGLLDMFTTTQPPLDSSNKLASTEYVDASVAVIDDFLSAFYYLPPATTKTIPVYKQMAVMGGSLVLDGTLIIDGQLYVEA